MISKNKTADETKKETAENVTFDIKVTRVKEIKENTYAFDMVVNGITIYGCYLNEGINASGEEYSVINFPASKGKDNKFYNHVYFKIDEKLHDEICEKIGALLNG